MRASFLATKLVALVVLMLLVAVSFVPVMFGLGAVYFVSAAAGGAFLLILCLKLAAEPTRSRAMGAFLGSLVQLLSIILGITLESL